MESVERPLERQSTKSTCSLRGLPVERRPTSVRHASLWPILPHHQAGACADAAKPQILSSFVGPNYIPADGLAGGRRAETLPAGSLSRKINNNKLDDSAGEASRSLLSQLRRPRALTCWWRWPLPARSRLFFGAPNWAPKLERRGRSSSSHSRSRFHLRSCSLGAKTSTDWRRLARSTRPTMAKTARRPKASWATNLN